MSGHLLSALIVLPAAAGVAALLVKEDWQKRVALGGAFLTFLLAVWAFVGHARAPDLQAAYEADGGLLEAALDERELDEPLEREVFRSLLHGAPAEPAVAAEERRRRLSRLAQVPLARRLLADVVAAGEAERRAAARRKLAAAEARYAAYAELLASIEADLGDVRLAAYGELRTRYRRVELSPWIPALGVQYLLGADGVSVSLALLTALIALLAALAAPDRDERRAVLGLVLLLEAAILGVLFSLDLVLFYAFWVLSLLPTYALLVREGSAARDGVALRFALPAALGALALLVAGAALALSAPGGRPCFGIPALVEHARAGGDAAPGLRLQGLAFAGIALACAVRLPLFPLHGWLGATQEHTTPAFGALLQGAFLPTGLYGLYRLAWPLCPDVAGSTAVATAAAVVGLVSVAYGGLAALAQGSAVRIPTSLAVAWAGLGVVGLASLTPTGLAGAVLAALAGGAASAAACLGLGLLADRTGQPDLAALNGVGLRVPRLGGLSAAALLALGGLPGTGAFVAAVLVLLGAWESAGLPGWVAVAVLPGLAASVLAAVLFLQRLRSAAGESSRGGLADLGPEEGAALVPLVLVSLLLGLYPRAALDLVGPPVEDLLHLLAGA